MELGPYCEWRVNRGAEAISKDCNRPKHLAGTANSQLSQRTIALGATIWCAKKSNTVLGGRIPSQSNFQAFRRFALADLMGLDPSVAEQKLCPPRSPQNREPSFH